MSDSETPSPAGAPRILVVEDLSEVRDFLLHQLRGRGYVVEEASSGSQAVDLCDENEYDLVLMDIGLPGLDGVEACRRIMSAHPERRPPKVVMLTAHADRGLILESLAAGALGYLLKPITGEMLIESVESFLGGGQKS